MYDLKTRLYWIEGAGRPPTALLLCSGEIDVSNVSTLEHGLEAAIETGAPVVEVDLRKVELLDSSTMEVLLSAYQELITEGRTLRLQASPNTWRLIRLLRLDGVLVARTRGDQGLSGASKARKLFRAVTGRGDRVRHADRTDPTAPCRIGIDSNGEEEHQWFRSVTDRQC